MALETSNILLIYTGGTIGMVKEPETGALKAFNFDQLLNQIPELRLLEHHIEAVSFEHPLDSSNMKPEYYVKIAQLIEQYYDSFDGFVVLHGSDTMAYSASVMSFILENLRKPVIYTGSQLPIGDLRTDAKENLITSIQLAGLKENGRNVLAEVGLYFEYKLYRANRTSKINAEHFQAFASMNYPPLAESGVHLKVDYPLLKKPSRKKTLKVHYALDNNILIIKLFPGINEELLRHTLNSETLKGIILETYGSGNACSEAWFLTLIKEAMQKGIYVVNVTQCVGGSVAMGKYETSTGLRSLGIISGKDITTEAAVAKMMYLLPKNLGPKVFKTIFETALRGEMQ